ncbi:glycoprotein-N-acetylgalactosamine 3-beta-galactosyltransferase 1-like [Teleopsis dalmanni]|uniref:glycoprotein-N-acetylgalactosamine 3-beta-galactosyltransferase 1-like n=1 Tax=Teleopsis dalmanni TaxID=139649 RepID=UPI000D32B1B3|nr:glycoprotein-N-acetylgalactosamine 3-beta-galactosyltransferase 1-like [Teleopsis dalmanni]
MFYKNLLCLLIGLIVGIRLTEFWNYFKFNVSSRTTEATNDSASTTAYNGEHSEGSSLAAHLYNNTRVLCWIMTTPANHLKRALHVKQTWGKRCNKLLFMSTQEDKYLDAIKLPVLEGRLFLWNKTREAFKYIYEHHLNDADWFLKADDDTYVIMENLRLFLYPFSKDFPVYFGCKFHPFVKQGYMSGGAGYVLSKEALRRFVEVGYTNRKLCSHNNLSEDKEMGICLQNIGVVAGDSRDEFGQERFLPLAPIHLLPVDTSEWYTAYLFYKQDENSSCCSSRAISFHYIKPKEFYSLEYLLYKVRPFAVHDGTNKLPDKANMTALFYKWRHELSDNIFKN